MNPMMIAAAGLMLGASIWAFYSGNPLSAGIYLCYGTANALLAFVKG